MDEFQEKVEETTPVCENKPENTSQYTEAKVNTQPAGQGDATGALICGIIGIVCWFFGWSSIGSIVLGIVGICLASKSKNAGFTGGTRTAGFILSIISLVGGAFFFLACVACIGLIGAASLSV